MDNVFSNVNTDTLIMQWQEAQKRLAVAKDAERNLRDAIVDRLFKDAKKGTNRHTLGKGYFLKFVKKVNLSLNKPETFQGDSVDLVNHVATLCEGAAANEGRFIIERLFKYKVEVSTTEMNKLKTDAATYPKIKQLLDIVTPFVLEKDGAPELTLEEPKNK